MARRDTALLMVNISTRQEMRAQLHIWGRTPVEEWGQWAPEMV